MPTPTPKLGIPKPLGNETVSRAAFNTIYDTIDQNAQKNIYQGSTAPASPVDGDIWIDTSTTPNALKRYSAGAWVQIGIASATDIHAARTDQANTFSAKQTAPQWVSNAPQGTPPLQVASSTQVANLNAEMVGGKRASDFAQTLFASTTIYVDPVNGNDSNPGTQQQPFRTIQAAVNSLPKVLSAAATIQLAAGTYNETVNITAFLGMTITLLGNTSNPSSVVLNGSIWVYECGKVSIKGITIQNFSMLAVYNESSIVEVSKCVINGSALSDSNTRTGISSNFGARTRVLNTSFSSFGASSVTLRGCIYGGYSSQISVYTCQFTDVDVAFAVDASIIHGFSGTFTFSSVTTQTLAKNGGQIWEIP